MTLYDYTKIIYSNSCSRITRVKLLIVIVEVMYMEKKGLYLLRHLFASQHYLQLTQRLSIVNSLPKSACQT